MTLDEVLEANDALHREFQSLSAELAEVRSRRVKLESASVDDLKAGIAAAEAEIVSLTKGNAELERQLASVNAEIATLRSKDPDQEVERRAARIICRVGIAHGDN